VCGIKCVAGRCSECLFCVWYKVGGGVSGQSSVFSVVCDMWRNEWSECLFRVYYNICGGVKCLSVCFLCGLRYVLE